MEQYLAELRELALTTGITLVSIAAAVLVNYARLYLARLKDQVEHELGADKLKLLETFAENAIRSAAQLGGLDTPESRKMYVFNLLNTFVDSRGIEITDAELNAIIEGVYNRLKRELDDEGP